MSLKVTESITALYSLKVLLKFFKVYGSPIPIAKSNRKAKTKTNTFAIRPIKPKIRSLDIIKAITANIIPIIDKMLKTVIPK